MRLVRWVCVIALLPVLLLPSCEDKTDAEDVRVDYSIFVDSIPEGRDVLLSIWYDAECVIDGNLRCPRSEENEEWEIEYVENRCGAGVMGSVGYDTRRHEKMIVKGRFDDGMPISGFVLEYPFESGKTYHKFNERGRLRLVNESGVLHYEYVRSYSYENSDEAVRY